MKLHILTSAALALAMSACSLERELVPSDSGGQAVAFGTPEVTTRALATTEESLRKIGVFGYSHTGDFGDGAGLVPDYFLNRPVAKLTPTDPWTYDGVTKYWPMDGRKLSFFAFAPYVFAPYPDQTDIFMAYPNQRTDTGAPRIAYTVPDKMLSQIDLVWSNRPNMTGPDVGGRVNFDMLHALTRVDFEVRLDEDECMGDPFIVEFNSIEVRGVAGSGTFDLNTDPDPDTTEGWTGIGSKDKSYTIVPGVNGGLADLTLDARNTAPTAGQVDPWSYTRLFVKDHYLMLIPQTLTPAAEVVLKYTLTPTGGGRPEQFEITRPLKDGTHPDWVRGKSITYQFTITRDGEIGFRIYDTPWDLVNEDEEDHIVGKLPPPPLKLKIVDQPKTIGATWSGNRDDPDPPYFYDKNMVGVIAMDAPWNTHSANIEASLEDGNGNPITGPITYTWYYDAVPFEYLQNNSWFEEHLLVDPAEYGLLVPADIISNGGKTITITYSWGYANLTRGLDKARFYCVVSSPGCESIVSEEVWIELSVSMG